jgi:hypothetical protein
MRGIIFIDRNNLYYYGGNVHTVLTLPFVPTVVKDIEIINGEAFERQLDEFITKNKIDAVDVAIIVSRNSSFEKYIPTSPEKRDLEEDRKEFIGNVPFEQILDQKRTDEKGTRFIAINQEFVYLIKEIFEKYHFCIMAISSVAALTPQGDITFSAASAQDLFKNAPLIKEISFPLEEHITAEVDMYADEQAPKKKRTNLYLLLGFFAVLMAILVYLLLNRPTPTKKKIPKKTSQATSVTETVTPTIAASVASPAAQITEFPKSALTIRILNGSGITGQADEIREKLNEKGYTDIVTGNATTLESSKTLIVTKPRVSAAQKQEITEIMQSVTGTDASVQENADIEADILITTARNPSSPAR